MNKLSIISARLLLTLQSAIPEYTIINPTSACTYSGIEGEKGIEYISCILIAMKFFSEFLSKKTKEDNLIYIKMNIQKKYNSFKSDKNIRKLLYKKQDYLNKQESKIKKPKKANKISINESISLPKNFPEALKKQENLINDYYVANLNNARQIVNLVTQYIFKSKPFDSGITESSCCYLKNNKYYDDIRSQYQNIDKLIRESNKLDSYKYLILLNGFYSRYYNNITFRYKGTPVFSHTVTENDKDIISKKPNYYSGNYIGEKHNFIGNSKLKKSKCNEVEYYQ